MDEIFDRPNLEWCWEQVLQRKKILVSDRLKKILNQMLQDKMKNRFQSATEVLQVLNNSVTGFQSVSSSNTGKMPVPQQNINIGKIPISPVNPQNYTEILSKIRVVCM